MVNIGHKQTEEHKRKIGEANKGHRHSETSKRKISQSMTGKKNHQWRGGLKSEALRIRHSLEFRLWREAVFERDNYICQKYGITDWRLNTHHIKNFAEYPELRFAIDNGITLSEKAHKEFHKIYGKLNNTKEQIEAFLKK